MVHGYPDWSNKRQTTVHQQPGDLAELAARLGCISVYDRRGNILWMDNFHHGWASWSATASGTGAEVVLDDVYPRWPPFCLKMTGGSTSAYSARVDHFIQPQVLGRLGLEVDVQFHTHFNALYLYLQVDDGTLAHVACIGLSDTYRTLHYYGGSGTWPEVDDLPDFFTGYGMYNSIKVVADFSTDKYVRLLFNQSSYDLSAYDLPTASSSVEPRITVAVDYRSRTGQNDVLRLGGVIVTQNEP